MALLVLSKFCSIKNQLYHKALGNLPESEFTFAKTNKKNMKQFVEIGHDLGN